MGGFGHASYTELDNLVAIIDVNRLGQRGETMRRWDLDSYTRRAEACGCHAIAINGRTTWRRSTRPTQEALEDGGAHPDGDRRQESP